ncbi:MAG: ATP-binding cassette domain-containing protein [Gemmatimonadaceae bacterium]
MTPPLVEGRGLGMRFPGVQALSGVSFDVRAGEVHALLGENGAGKSTLVRILSGEQRPTEGEVVVDGAPRHYASPRDALADGIAVIPQELQLVSSLTVAENIALGHESVGPGRLVDRAAHRQRAAEVLQELGAGDISPDATVASLGAGERQLVAIARALGLRARCLFMDEPTASLGTADADRLASIVTRLTERGTGIVYITHKLDEVRRLADRITVLRDGAWVTTCPAEGVSEAEMVRLMVGRTIAPATLTPVAPDAPEVLQVDSLALADPTRPDGFRLRDISFSVRRGEIVGLAGLIGAGRSETLLAIAGAVERGVSGRLRLNGQPYQPISPAEARAAGLVMLPEERKAQGILPKHSVRSNVSISSLPQVSRAGFIDRGRERQASQEFTRATGVRAASDLVPMETLSGGNQQKALLARAMFAAPKVLLLDEPTRGIDLAAKSELYEELRRLAQQGYGIVMASSELSEVLTQCHRILVFRDGRITAELHHDEASEEKILAAAASGTHAATPDRTPERMRPAGGGGAPSGPGWRERLRGASHLLGLMAVLLLAIVTSPVRGGRPVFLDLGNLSDILRQVAEKGILAVGMTAVVIAGGIDLSVGSMLALGATLSAYLFMQTGAGLGVTLLIVLAVGALWGLLNGTVIARWKLPAFIATLATMSAARGVARYVSGGTAIPLGFGAGGAPESVHRVAAPVLPNVPMPAVIFLLTVLAAHVLLTRTRGGRYLYAIGDNESAARLAGVRVAWHTTAVYVLCGTLAALAGLIHCAQLEQGNPNDGVAYELDAIAAVVIGGTPLRGGVGSVAGTLVGILIIGIINNSMGLNNVDANLQLILKGIIILGAVWLQRRR